MKDVYSKVSAQPRTPIIFGCHRTNQTSQLRRQHRPQDYKIKMAGVVGKINPLAGNRLAVHPLHRGSGQSSGQGGDQAGKPVTRHRYRLSNPRKMFAVLRQMVTTQPIVITTRAIQTSVPGCKNLSSTTESRHATVSVAMR